MLGHGWGLNQTWGHHMFGPIKDEDLQNTRGVVISPIYDCVLIQYFEHGNKNPYLRCDADELRITQ